MRRAEKYGQKMLFDEARDIYGRFAKISSILAISAPDSLMASCVSVMRPLSARSPSLRVAAAS
jgi:hypothetical protein